MSITGCRLYSLSVYLVHIVCERIVLDSTGPPLAATDAHVRIGGKIQGIGGIVALLVGVLFNMGSPVHHNASVVLLSQRLPQFCDASTTRSYA